MGHRVHVSGSRHAVQAGTALRSSCIQWVIPARSVYMALLRGRHTQSSSCNRRQPAGAKSAGMTGPQQHLGLLVGAWSDYADLPTPVYAYLMSRPTRSPRSKAVDGDACLSADTAHRMEAAARYHARFYLRVCVLYSPAVALTVARCKASKTPMVSDDCEPRGKRVCNAIPGCSCLGRGRFPFLSPLLSDK